MSSVNYRKGNVRNMVTKKKSWVEKLADSKGLPKVEKITDKMSKRWGTGMWLFQRQWKSMR